MQDVAADIERALLGGLETSPLRTVGGFNWIQHVAMSAMTEERGEPGTSWSHCRQAALSFVASLDLLSRPGATRFFRLPDGAVADAVSDYMLPVLSDAFALVVTTCERFAREVGLVMSGVFGQMRPVVAGEDLSLMANAYLNSSGRLPADKGAFFVRCGEGGRSVGVELSPVLEDRDEVRPDLAAWAASAYCRELLLNVRAGTMTVPDFEMARIERSVASISGVAIEGRNVDLCRALEGVISLLPARRIEEPAYRAA
jgi:hypothetical protein